MSKIKLFINISEPSKKDYERVRLEYIADYEQYESGGFFSEGKFRKRPDVGEARWNQKYPEGYSDWCGMNGDRLSSYGQRELVRKLNEVIKEINKLKSGKKDI